jgi:hypothetical protein
MSQPGFYTIKGIIKKEEEGRKERGTKEVYILYGKITRC